ncbi:unnamed protein product [Mytilus coruscus]|uniref:B box-type domain-containing protein n=1 Tax=Mytilus coruscus TaxID=42192 RepID=A0A6J8BWA9_MYTCO|nr:unnamed protein product [Mytilus coruscus]
MASNAQCSPCSEGGKSMVAFRFCSDCEEMLCKDCVVYHRKFKATKSHHLIEASSIKTTIPLTNKYCTIHKDIFLNFYCVNHDKVCCRACIPKNHQSCKDVIPLEVASQSIKGSYLLADMRSVWKNMNETLCGFDKDQQNNIIDLEKMENNILQQIANIKIDFLKEIEKLEQNFKTDLAVVKSKNLIKSIKTKSSLSNLTALVQKKNQALEFLKENGPNTQLFLELKEQVTEYPEVSKRVQELISSSQRTILKLKEPANMVIPSIGSLIELKEPCNVRYNPVHLSIFRKENEIQLLPGAAHHITNCVATMDNKLLLCNFEYGVNKIYIYTDCKDYATEICLEDQPYAISIFLGTNEAVVTLPNLAYLQLVNTRKMEKSGRVNIDKGCYAVTTFEDTIIVGKHDEIQFLKKDSTTIHIFTLCNMGLIKSVYYFHKEHDIVCRSKHVLRRIKLDFNKSRRCEVHESLQLAKFKDKVQKLSNVEKPCEMTSKYHIGSDVIYQYNISGEGGLAVDEDECLYVCNKSSNQIIRLAKDGLCEVIFSRDVCLENPYSIFFSHNFTKFVISDTLGFIHVFNVKRY